MKDGEEGEEIKGEKGTQIELVTDPDELGGNGENLIELPELTTSVMQIGNQGYPWH